MSQHENSASTATDPAARLPATLRLGAVHLTVSDLDRSVLFYERAIGLKTHRREAGEAAMGVGEEDLIVLVEKPGSGARGATRASTTTRCSIPPARSSPGRRCA